MSSRRARTAALLRSLPVVPTGALDDVVIETPSSVLVPVILSGPLDHLIIDDCLATSAGSPLMLKCSFDDEERQGLAAQAAWPAADGVFARVLWIEDFPHEDEPMRAALMERAVGARVLGFAPGDTLRLCERIADLHTAPPAPSAACARWVPLDEWFRALTNPQQVHHNEVARLEPAQTRVIERGREFAQELLASPLDSAYLHGDVHHGNLLDFGVTWKFIDPKALHGESLFDYCNLMFNPDLSRSADSQVFAGRLSIVVNHVEERFSAPLRERYLRWLVAYGALSASWHLEDGGAEQASGTLAVAARALEQLEQLAATSPLPQTAPRS
ncbi:aminoglycoside phosphotransferase family protein [Timonella senegalensis]|uniref:aminoglycoside phosphotransferase family protein n=1 Tax=Timonella senegalensis TaxID=1465825 RepID=UPI0002FC6936|nr:aminoglycoside phosphotransferase family protein [Timonella senegalensis]